MPRRGNLLVLMLCALIAIVAIASQAIISHQLSQQTQDDLRSILEGLENTPPPPLREIGTLTPYAVDSEYSLVEVGGAENANTTFSYTELGLEVQLHVHACRPQVMPGSGRQGELNLIDGSGVDRCTSGGVMSIVDKRRREEFQIHFKLLGAPGGTIFWNARQLVSERDPGQTWLATLESLRSSLPQCEQTGLPRRLGGSEGVTRIRDAMSPHALLMSGDEHSMQRLMSFRGAFRRLYDNPDPAQAQCVARLLIDTLLESPEQRELSDKWVEELCPVR